MENIVGPRPSMVGKMARNLMNELVKSNQSFIKSAPGNWLMDLPELKGMFPCGRCHICKFVERTDILM